MQKKISDTSQSAASQKWFLRILDKSIFGPVDLDTLCDWANQARIIPGHHISSDKTNWTAVETIHEFRMIWEVAMKNGDIYGPINISLLKSLIQDDIINTTATITNITTGETSTIINQMMDLINEDYNLRIRLEEAYFNIHASEVQCKKLQQEIKQEKKLRKTERAEHIIIQEKLKTQIEQTEQEKHAVEVIEVYPEAILINNDSALAKSNICTQETLEQLEAQAANDLTTWHELFKKSAKKKKNRFLPIKLFQKN